MSPIDLGHQVGPAPSRVRRAARTAAAVLALACAAVLPSVSHALTLPAGFDQSTAIGGLTDATDVEVALGGRVFVAEKSGLIRTYDSLSDTSAHTFADLRTNVHNHSSRGLLSLALDPGYPAEPYLYAYYVLDAPIGGTPPTWGNAGATNDPCFSEGDCLASSRVSKLLVSGEDMSGPEQVLVNDWCQQFQFHTGGGLEFGADGNLYVSGGDGARWGIWDYGQLGNPPNPCGDPPGNTPGSVLTPPTAEGGRLRAQDLRTGGDPLGLAGSLARIDPDTGAGVIGNPMFGSADPNARRMLAHGFRNAVRLAIRPGTNDVWVADRGGGYFEELDRVPDPTDPVRNFGWPCYEGGMDANGNPYPRVRPRSDDQDLDICENLYSEVTATHAPYWAYDHEQPVVPGEDCATNPDTGEPAGNQISGIAFYPAAGPFPAPYRGALFFGDRLRNCIYAMLPGSDGIPDRGQVIPFAQGADEPFAIEITPGGDMLYVDKSAEAIQRVTFPGGSVNQPPNAVAESDVTTGERPLTVNFDAGASDDPDPGDVIAYEWDLDGDGQLDDSTSPQPTFTYMTAGTFTVTLRVTDTSGESDTDTISITVTGPPAATIASPSAGTTWGAGQSISFSGSGADSSGAALPPSALDWTVVFRDCSGTECDEHLIGEFPDTASGTFTAPDQAHPGDIEVRLTVTEPGGQSDSRAVSLAARTVGVSLSATPAQANLILNDQTVSAPATRAVVYGSTNSLSAPVSQTVDGTTYRFSSWSDGQPRSRTFVASSSRSFSATFAPVRPGTQTLTFTPEADTRAEQALPNGNFGASNELRTDDTVESFLRFQVAGLSGRVTSAKLRLRATSDTLTVDGPAARGTGGGWSEAGLTWANRPPPTTGVIADVGQIGSGTWVEWDVTGQVTGDAAVSLNLAQPSNDGVNFHSREAASQDNRPQLQVTFTNDSYPRPTTATATRASLVPAYVRCTAPNRQHGPPLDAESCNPAAPSSPHVTVGPVPGSQAAAIGSVRYSVIAGNPATPADDADVRVVARMTDVRDAGTMLDYLGELQVRATLRITDRANGPGLDESGTVQDLSVPVTMPCDLTLDVSVGADCAVSTSLDSVLPGIVRERARSIWELGQFEVLDGGPDGAVDTTPNEVFARQGVFIP